MSARITEVRDAAAAKINTAWVSRESADDEVIAKYRVDWKAESVRGRKVQVFPSTYTGQPANRSEDQDDYTIVVMVAERYAGPGDPPEEWTDARVEWCEWLLRLLGNPRDTPLLAVSGQPTSGLWPQEAEVTTVFDYEELSERKLFLSVITVTFREEAAV